MLRTEENVHSEATQPVLVQVARGFKLLAELHQTLASAGQDDASLLARDHVTRATRELAAVQRLYERRGRP